MRARGEGGSVTLVAVACAGALLVLGAALGVVSALVKGHRDAQAAADLAALAAAQSLVHGGDACAAGAALATANGGLLTSCTVAGREVAVRVRVTGPHWLGLVADLEADARAGPG